MHATHARPERSWSCCRRDAPRRRSRRYRRRACRGVAAEVFEVLLHLHFDIVPREVAAQLIAIGAEFIRNGREKNLHRHDRGSASGNPTGNAGGDEEAGSPRFARDDGRQTPPPSPGGPHPAPRATLTRASLRSATLSRKRYRRAPPFSPCGRRWRGIARRMRGLRRKPHCFEFLDFPRRPVSGARQLAAFPLSTPCGKIARSFEMCEYESGPGRGGRCDPGVVGGPRSSGSRRFARDDGYVAA